MRKVALALAVLAIPALAAAQSRKPAAGKKAAAPPALKPTVQVAGMRVVGPGVGSQEDQQRPFNWSPGVTVVVAVRVNAPYALVGVDKEASAIALTDSAGNVLRDSEVDWNPDFTRDGTAALVELEAKGVPADGSTHVALKGNLTFTVASGTKVVKANAVKLEQGTTVKLGTATITMGDVQHDAENGEWQLTFKGATPVMKGIKVLRARDAKGEAVEARWWSGGGWTEEWETGYRIKTAAKSPLNLEFELHDGLRAVSVPIDLKAGVGIPAE
jgi:hypothetical protein